VCDFCNKDVAETNEVYKKNMEDTQKVLARLEKLINTYEVSNE
jgi:hypothetical protein